MFASAVHPEETKLDAMQRVWQPNFQSTFSVFDDNIEITPFTPPRQTTLISTTKKEKTNCKLPEHPPSFTCSDNENDEDIVLERNVSRKEKLPAESIKPQCLILNASDVGDIPACYVVHPVKSHQFPVCGVYVDKRVIPGFKYLVRPLPGLNKNSSNQKCLFGGRALVLKSIGRGYSRRFTFEADPNNLNDNMNYFWSDNRPEGYAFELEVVSEGDKFTVFDANKQPQATAEIIKVEDNQIELGGSVNGDVIEKKVKVKLIAKVEFFETGVAQLMPIGGVAICVKKRGQQQAEITRIIHVNIKQHRYYLSPGFYDNFRRVSVRGADIDDVPTKYTMTGLRPYEIPVVGTYIDPRVIPGFRYRVRPNDRKRHLFNGESLKLQSIGIGYAKRLTFESESKLNPTNYLWSDNHRDGLGLEPRAVLKDMKFQILSGDQVLGEAKVFRDEMPQMEESMEKVETSSGKHAVVKYIQIDVFCHIKLESSERGLSENERLMRVCGLAVVRKEPGAAEAKIVKVVNVGLDSQLRVLFVNSNMELTFIPLQ